MKPVNLSIIIINFNSLIDLLECLQSIYNNTKGISFEIIVVDNKSNNQIKVKEYIQTHFPSVRLFLSSRNLGFAAANNVGMSKAYGHFVLLLNPDTIIKNDAIEKMYNYLNRNTDLGVVGPLIFDEIGNIQYYCGRTFPDILTEIFHHSGLSKKFPRNKVFGRYLMTYWDHKTSREVDLIQGSCMMFPKKVLNLLGKMDERFFLFGDDVEWCYRIKNNKMKVYLYAQATIIHKGEKSTKGNNILSYLIGFDSMFRFFSIYYSKAAGIMYRILLFLLFSMKLGVSLILKQRFMYIYLDVIKWTIGAFQFSQDLHGQPSFKRAL